MLILLIYSMSYIILAYQRVNWIFLDKMQYFFKEQQTWGLG
jgi:hypothetical protein